MARIYIAARFSRRPEANRLAHVLQAAGHHITSRWVRPDCDHVLPTGLSARAADAERERFALEDLQDLNDSNWVISLQEEPRSNDRGGRHVELGYAIALGMRITIVGPRETVFHHLPDIEHYPTMAEFLPDGWQFVSAPPDEIRGDWHAAAAAEIGHE